MPTPSPRVEAVPDRCVQYTCGYTSSEDRMRTNVVLNDELVAEAFALTGVRTKKELIHLALRELIRVRRKKDLSELAGRISLRDDYDHKAMRTIRRDLG